MHDNTCHEDINTSKIKDTGKRRRATWQ